MVRQMEVHFLQFVESVSLQSQRFPVLIQILGPCWTHDIWEYVDSGRLRFLLHTLSNKLIRKSSIRVAMISIMVTIGFAYTAGCRYPVRHNVQILKNDTVPAFPGNDIRKPDNTLLAEYFVSAAKKASTIFHQE